MAIRVAITGCCGRMGRRIASLAERDEDFRITAAVEAKRHPDVGKNLYDVIGIEGEGPEIITNLADVAGEVDVIIDFTTPTATVSNLGIARSAKVPIVVGTTGITDEEQKVVKSVSGSVPVLISSNMSLGINVLLRVIGDVANALGENYDIEIIEAHHNKKKDAPSGTAKSLAEAIAEAKGKRLQDIALYGREGNVGARKKGELGIHAIRGGDIVGDHTVIYAGANERIEITHRAHSRDVLAQGALYAAKFLMDRSPGLYSMQDVIGGLDYD